MGMQACYRKIGEVLWWRPVFTVIALDMHAASNLTVIDHGCQLGQLHDSGTEG